MKTLIAIPCHDMVHAKFMESVLQMEKPDDTSVAVVTGTLIYNARNIIANNAIKEGFDRIMWMDSDMVFPQDTIIKLSERLDEGLDLVTGLYFTRRSPILPVVYGEIHWEVDKGVVKTWVKNYAELPKDLFEIGGCGFGCVMMSVDLLRKIHFVYGSPFYPLIGMGEDLSFCWRVKEQGLKMYCDPTIKCGHIGNKIYLEEDWERL